MALGSRAVLVVVEHGLSSSVAFGIKLVSPALAGGFFITEPPEKPLNNDVIFHTTWMNP